MSINQNTSLVRKKISINIFLTFLQVHSMELRALPTGGTLPRPKSETNFTNQELSRESRRIFHKSDTFHKDSYQ